MHRREIWEVGRQSMDVQVAELEYKGERPEILLAVEVEEEVVVLGEAITSSAPHTALATFIERAMRQPLAGPPRRPGLIRVASQADANVLAPVLVNTGVAVEIVAQLPTLDAVLQHMTATLGGLNSDYRSCAAQAGQTLSPEGLQAFFQTAETFYRRGIWDFFGDEVLFEIAMQPDQGEARTAYGVLMGSLGEEFGLVLYQSLDDFQRFFDLSREHLDHFESLHPGRDEDLQEVADITAQFMSIPTLTLSYTAQRDVPEALLREAEQLKLRVAKKAAFPLVLSTRGDMGMQVATAAELGYMLCAMRAILDWDERIDDEETEEDMEVTITSQLPAVPDFLPALTVHTRVLDNPCMPEEDEDDEAIMATLDSFLSSRSQPSVPKPVSNANRGKPSKPSSKGDTASGSNLVYTLDVYLADGPIDESYADQEISRRIDILGKQTLHDLHEAIFDAFDRWEEHLYEFNLGEGPHDQSALYMYSGGWDEPDEGAGNPETTMLGDLALEVGRRFGYIFDLGDQWAHVIEVVATKKATGKGKFPRVVKKVGTAPPQYPEDDEDF
jgi:hypothetical protein